MKGRQASVARSAAHGDQDFQTRTCGESTILMVYYFNTKNQYVDDNEREIKLGIKIGGFLGPEY